MTSPFDTFGSGQNWPSDPTVPPAAPPGYTTPPVPNPAQTQPPQTSQQIEALGTALIDGILAQVLLAVANISIGGETIGQAFPQLQQWATQLEQDAQNALTNAGNAQTTANSALANWTTLFEDLGANASTATELADWLTGTNTSATTSINNWTTLLEALGLPAQTVEEFINWLQTLLEPNSPLNASNLWGLLPSNVATNVSSTSVNSTVIQQLWNPNFETALALQPNAGWSWDSAVYYTPETGTAGSATMTANGSLFGLRSNPIPVSSGQSLALSVQILTSGLVLTGTPIELGVVTYKNGTQIAVQSVAASGVPSGAATSWTGAPSGAVAGSLSGTYTVPNDGSVDAVLMRLAVDDSATAGQVWFGAASAELTGGLIATLQSDLTSLSNDFTAGNNAFATFLQSALSDITGYTNYSTFITALESAWNTYITTATDLTNAEFFTLQQLINTLLGFNTTTGQLPATNVSNALGGSSLAADVQAILDYIANALGHSGTGHSLSQIESYLGLIPAANVTNVLGGANLGADVSSVNSTASSMNTWWSQLLSELGITPGTSNGTNVGSTISTASSNASNASTTANSAQANVNAILTPFESVNGFTSTAAWQQSWNGLMNLLGIGTSNLSVPTAPTGLVATGNSAASSLAAGTYYWVVTAVVSGAETGMSNEVSLALTGTYPSATLTWNALAGATGYKVYRGTSPGGENVQVDSLTGTSYTDSGSTIGAGTPPQPTKAIPAAALPNIVAGSGAGQSSDLQTLFNSVVSWFQQNGSTTTGQSATDANLAVQTIANTVSGLSTKVQNQLTGSVGASQSGQSFQVNFANYPNGPFSAAPFNVTYGPIPGGGSAGTGDLVISGGDATWNAVNNGDVSAVGIFSGFPAGGGTFGQAYTNTDYQEIQASLAGLPNGAGSKNFAILRANASSAPTTYVYGLVYLSTSLTLDWEIGCYVNGTHTVFASGTDAPLNLNFTMVAGVGGNPYRFQGISGDKVVFDYTDGAKVSQLGAGYRYWGFRSDTYSNGQITPAPAAYIGCADNTPPTLVGSGFRQYCSGANGTFAATLSLNTIEGFAANFMDTVAERTPDFSMSSSASQQSPYAVVANAGWYEVEFRCDMSSNVASGAVTVTPVLQRFSGGSPLGTLEETKLMPSSGYLVNGFGGQYSSTSFGGSCGIFCNAGDCVQIGYYLTTNGGGALTTLTFSGEATGAHTYWGMRLSNWSLN